MSTEKNAKVDFASRASLTPQELSDWSGVPERKIRDAMARGELDYIDMSQKTKVVEPADFLAWMRKRKTGTSFSRTVGSTNPSLATSKLPPARRKALLGGMCSHRRRCWDL
jgi:hypothetical protein